MSLITVLCPLTEEKRMGVAYERPRYSTRSMPSVVLWLRTSVPKVHDTQKRCRSYKTHTGGGIIESPPCRSQLVCDHKSRSVLKVFHDPITIAPIVMGPCKTLRIDFARATECAMPRLIVYWKTISENTNPPAQLGTPWAVVLTYQTSTCAKNGKLIR